MYKELLNSKGLKSTPQRIMVLSAIAKSGHIDIDQLAQACKESVMNVPLTTLYRILGELSSVGILHTVTLLEGKTKYEIAKGEHPHFLCEQCAQLEDLKVPMNDIINIAQNACVHSTRSVSILLQGVCQSCSADLANQEEK